MNSLIILSFISIAAAAPQYNYDQGSSGFGGGAAPSQNFASAAAPAVYNKQFYIHSAPEEALEEATNQFGQALQTSRNLRVVFIKAPENKGLENAALQLAKSASDQQTAIYVLNKQTDLGDLEHKLSQVSNPSLNKPEVHFVKYKTPEEAEHAQHSIQAQYNGLAGPTSVSNEGVAPIQSFVGSVPSQGGFNGIPSHGHGVATNPTANYLPPVAPSSNYLPPSLRRF